MDRQTLHDATILVVDDEPEVVDVIRAALVADGYRRVVTTTLPVEVLEHCRAALPDLLILDMNMPGVHGMDIIEELHSVVPDEEYLPILVVTGNQDVEVKLRALTWGAKDFLAKPFEVPELLLRVRMLLETRLLFNRVTRPDGR